MVVKMIKKWRPWPPLTTKKFEAKIIVKNLKGLQVQKLESHQEFSKLAVEIKWKGSKGNAWSSLRRSVRRNFTKEESSRDQDGVVEWNEEFECLISNFTGDHPWEVVFTLINGLNGATSGKASTLATAILNITDFVSTDEEKDIEISIPLKFSSSGSETNPSLSITLRLQELKTSTGSSDSIQRRSVSLPPGLSVEKQEVSSFTAGLRKVFTRKSKKVPEDESSDGRNSVRSEDVDYNYPLDTESSDDVDEVESEEDLTLEKSCNYGTLAYANHATGTKKEDWIFYSRSKSDTGNKYVESSPTSVLDESSRKSSMNKILPWKKRKLSFRGAKTKGEPLLKKYYGEEGGDDIDFDRRQFSSSDESYFGKRNNGDSNEFGDDNFAIGRWEQKEIISRDGHMKLQTQVFFASIDQRSERAAGESACTALVAVIADWFQRNKDEMPIKSQFDSLIREGSYEWRKLCENESYKERFPDKHFDLETVIQAKVRPLSVLPEKSFVGFFHPEGMENGDEKFDFLQGAMSFDNIWDEISASISESVLDEEPMVYGVSWNDHFFVLKVEKDAYYIIDTLGERLYEGCTEAFILKFDKDTVIQETAKESAEKAEKAEKTENEEELAIVCKGKESCKEYIKNFLAAIPIRELQVDLKKGLMASTPLHQRLQIEFHYTKSEVGSTPEEVIAEVESALEQAMAKVESSLEQAISEMGSASEEAAVTDKK